tara:strand:+ start:815 stop:1519 length:705 start_codon:yes stop_codon:yes gene_type:complete
MPLLNQKVLALIPARKGSKGIPNKNLKKINGKSLVCYTIEAAKKSKYIDEIYLSSNDSKIINLAIKSGIEILRRPEKYSSDKSLAEDVVKHFISSPKINKILKNIDPYIIYLQPTSPLRKSNHIDSALEEMTENNLVSAISVVEMDQSPFKSFVIQNNLLKRVFNKNFTNERRQDLPSTFYPNGAIYIFKASSFIKSGSFPSNGSYPFLMDKDSSIDIDTKEDWKMLCNYYADK